MIATSYSHGWSAQDLLDSHDEGRTPELTWTWSEVVKRFRAYELDFRSELSVHGHNDQGEALHCAGEILAWLGY